MESLFWRLVDLHNVIAGTQLANRPISQMIIDLLSAIVTARAPVGFEDETGFHYGVEMTGWSFTIYSRRKSDFCCTAKLKSILDFDSGGQSFFQRDSSSPPPWRLSPESVLYQRRRQRAQLLFG